LVEPSTIIELADASLAADYTRVRRAANAIVRQWSASGEDAAANELRSLLRKRGVPLRSSGYTEQLPVDAKSRLPLLEEQAPPEDPIFLSESAGRVVSDFVWDISNIEKLAGRGVSTKLNLLLSGAPGTGKTSLAGHIAASIGRPLYVVRLDSLMSSLLGDTSKNVRAMFDFFTHKGGVLFLDEMDAIAKLRDDRQELGELKRVVNTVIQGLDSVDDRSVIIGATNHPQLLDPAIWRRFPYKIEIASPDRSVRQQMWSHFLFEDKENDVSDLLAEISDGMTGADIRTVAFAARRHALMEERESIDLASVTSSILSASSGVPDLPSRHGISQDRTRILASELNSKGLNAPKIGALLGMSRQWALKLLKEDAENQI
jgi:KaiC/GvpD/RAD55 family RecA-like ATPase